MSITLELTDQDFEALALPTDRTTASLAVEGEAFGKIAAVLEPLPPLSRGVVMNLVNQHVQGTLAPVLLQIRHTSDVFSRIASAYRARAGELETKAASKRVSMIELASTLAPSPAVQPPPVRRGARRPRTVGLPS